jgi:surface protein
MANVTVRADADCFLLCDGEYLDIQLEAGKMTKIQVSIGQHLLEFIYTEDANIKVEKVVDFPEAGKNYLVLVQDLKAAADNVAAAAKAEEEAKRKAEEEAKRQAEEEAKRKAEEDEARRKAEELANSEPYAVYENGTLTFYFDTQKTNRGGMGLEKGQDEGLNMHEWEGHLYDIKTVIFDESFSNCHCIESTVCWFRYLKELTLIKGLNNLDTSKVEDMSMMFDGCSSMQSLDVSGFDTSKVTDMCCMFNDCSSLQSLDVSGFDTSKVEDMSYMFGHCSSMQSLDVSGFNTSKVTNMNGMFWGCSSLQSLDVSGFNTSKVMFDNLMFDGINESKIKKWE